MEFKCWPFDFGLFSVFRNDTIMPTTLLFVFNANTVYVLRLGHITVRKFVKALHKIVFIDVGYYEQYLYLPVKVEQLS